MLTWGQLPPAVQSSEARLCIHPKRRQTNHEPGFTGPHSWGRLFPRKSWKGVAPGSKPRYCTIQSYSIHDGDNLSQNRLRSLLRGRYLMSYFEVSSSIPCSSFSWHSMQCRVHGTASSRFALISFPHEMHSPNAPSRIRPSAPSTICNSWRSLLLCGNKNSLV